MSSKKTEKIAIVGAGVSGLTAAFRLAQKGSDVQVYEARDRVGGRILSVRVQGHIVELGGENIFNGGQAKNTAVLIADVCIPTEITRSPFKTYSLEENGCHSFQAFLQSHPCSSDLKEIAKSAKNMQEVLCTLFPEGGMGYNLTKTMLAGYEGAPVEQLSVFYIETLYYLLKGGLCSAHQHTSAEEPAYIDRMAIAGGNSLLPLALAEKLQGRVHLNHALQALSKDSSGCYTLLFSNGEAVRADVVVLTMPCPVYRDISISENALDEGRKRAIESIHYGTPSKVLLPLCKPGIVGEQYVHESFTTFISLNEHVVTQYYVGGHGQFSQEQLNMKWSRDFPLLQQIYPLDPSLQPLLSTDQLFKNYTSAVGHSWPNDPFAQGAYSCIGAGQEALFTSMSCHYGETVKTLFAPIDDALFFAGEHTSIFLDIGGTIEAAIESGERAARLISTTVSKRKACVH